jgi:uncharacterized protein
MGLSAGLRGAAWGLLAGILLFAAWAWAAAPIFPPLVGRVVDEAGILSPDTRQRLDTLLAQHERESGEQLVVVTLKSLQGYPIEEFGYQLGRHWGIGQKGKDNGVLLIVAPHERKVRIEVGYGLEGRLTDAQSRLIIEDVILPAFRQGDFDMGVLDGATAILRVLGGAPARAGREPAPRGSPSPFAGFIGIAFVLWIIFRGFFWPLLLLGRRGRYGPGPWGGGYYLGGGGFSGGGFSGGGGSFGGGGASGGW